MPRGGCCEHLPSACTPALCSYVDIYIYTSLHTFVCATHSHSTWSYSRLRGGTGNSRKQKLCLGTQPSAAPAACSRNGFTNCSHASMQPRAIIPRAHAKSIYLTPPLRLDPGTHPAIRRIVAEHHGVMQLRLAPESALFCLKVCHALSTSTSSRRRRFSNHMLRWRKISKGKTAARRRHAARGDRNAFDESNHTSSTALLLIRTRAVDGHTAGSSRAPPGRSLWPDLKWKSSIVKWGESWPCSA